MGYLSTLRSIESCIISGDNSEIATMTENVTDGCIVADPIFKKSTGKLYFEFLYNVDSGAYNNFIGIVDDTHSRDIRVGFSALSWSFMGNSGRAYHNSSVHCYPDETEEVKLTNDGVMGAVAVNLDTGEVWIGCDDADGDFEWLACTGSGVTSDPATGTDPLYTDADIIGEPMSPAFSLYADTSSCTIMLQESEFSRAIPSGFSAWDATEPLFGRISFVAMPYSDLLGSRLAYLDMIYSIAFTCESFVEMPYGIKMAMAMAMYYGDTPALQQIMSQYYGDAPALRRPMVHPYGDLLMLRKSIDFPYDIFKPLQAIMEARYGINGASIQAILEQGYALSEYNLLCKKLDMPYLLQADVAIEQVEISLVISGVAVAFNHLNIEASRSSFVITGEAHLADVAEYQQVNRGDIALATVTGEEYTFIVESKKRSRPGGAQTVFVVNLVSPAIILTAPWSETISHEFEPAQAETIINSLSGDLAPVDYQIVTFPVLPDTLYANDEDRRTIIRKLTQSVGAVLQSNPDGGLRVEPEYPVPVPEWENAPVDYYLTDERNFISQDETPIQKSGKNRYLVGNELASSDRIWTEQEELGDKRVQVLGFQVPWDDSLEVELTHTGGDTVHTPEYIGIVEETYPPLTEDAEQVEFVAGYATASRSIYGELQVEWLREQLGVISYAEDGKLEAELKTGETDGYSLAAVRYLTRYHLWIVQDDVSEPVQFLLKQAVGV